MHGALVAILFSFLLSSLPGYQPNYNPESLIWSVSFGVPNYSRGHRNRTDNLVKIYSPVNEYVELFSHEIYTNTDSWTEAERDLSEVIDFSQRNWWVRKDNNLIYPDSIFVGYKIGLPGSPAVAEATWTGDCESPVFRLSYIGQDAQMLVLNDTLDTTFWLGDESIPLGGFTIVQGTRVNLGFDAQTPYRDREPCAHFAWDSEGI